MVFGGTTGINLGIAHAFARNGASVTVASRKPENIESARAQLAARGHPVLGLAADVRDPQAASAAVEASVARFGPIDVLISGAAGNFLAPAKDLSPNGFGVVVDIDLKGTFHVMRAAYPHLRRPGGSVINITAPQGSRARRLQVHACAAKAGVDQVTRVLALEWGPEGIRVNAISPGPIDGTEGVRRLAADTPEAVQEYARRVPIGRLGTLDDVGNLALFLSSPHAGFISGAIVPCDGGGPTEAPGVTQATMAQR
jgi:NAD(P)-dependent dehydrogenase (short-subunit alcohol dehydrogenase family)